ALFLVVLSTSQAANAQCLNTFTSPTPAGAPFPGFGGPDPAKGLFTNTPAMFAFAGNAASSLATSLTTLNTVYLTQTTAFIGSPANAQPGQSSGGVWVRGVGGSIDTDSTTTLSAVGTAPGTPTGNLTCNTTTRAEFGGFQVGRDWA